MGVRIISDNDGAVLYCSTSMWAFGPVFDNEQDAEEFCDWFTEGHAISAAIMAGTVAIPALDDRASRDPRSWTQHDLERLHGIWMEQRKEATV